MPRAQQSMSLGQPIMEGIHFSGIPTLPALLPVHPFVNTIRGTLPTQPLHLSPPLELPGLSGKDHPSGFLTMAAAPMPAPVLGTPPPYCHAKNTAPAEHNSNLPRQSKCVAAQGHHRVSNPITQAQNILMMKWGITSEKHPPDAEAVVYYCQIYNMPLSPCHRTAVRALCHIWHRRLLLLPQTCNGLRWT